MNGPGRSLDNARSLSVRAKGSVEELDCKRLYAEEVEGAVEMILALGTDLEKIVWSCTGARVDLGDSAKEPSSHGLSYDSKNCIENTVDSYSAD